MKKRLLLVCGNGYVFQEVFVPLIYQVDKEYTVHVWIADFYISDSTRQLIAQISQLDHVEVIETISPYQQLESRYSWHQRIIGILKRIEDKFFDGVILSSDFQLFDKYLILLLSKQIKVSIVLQTGTIIRVLNEYRRLKGIKDSHLLSRSNDHLEVLRRCARSLRGLWYWLKFEILKHLDYKVIPTLLIGKELPFTTRDNLAFCSGYVDCAIVYDYSEKEVMKQLVPNLKRIEVAEHPAAFYSQQDRLMPQHRMLVIFSGNLTTEMRKDFQDQWVMLISTLCRRYSIKHIDMRFHPRMSAAMKWPEHIIHPLQQRGMQVLRIDSLKESLIDSIKRYDIVVGGPSGALRVVQAVNPVVKIFGFPNRSDSGVDDQQWILGEAKGIQWINDPTSLDNIDVSQVRKISREQSVLTIIKDLLKEPY